MRSLTTGILLLALVVLAPSVFAGQGQIGSLLNSMDIETSETGNRSPKLFGHISYYPASAWGFYAVDENKNRVSDTAMANYNIAAEFATPLKRGALGLGVYSFDGGGLDEKGLTLAYYAPKTWGLSFGMRKFSPEDGSESFNAPVFEALFFPSERGSKSQFTLGVGAFKPFDSWLPSLSVNASIPLRGNYSFDISVWGTREQVGDVAVWEYRWSGGVGYSF